MSGARERPAQGLVAAHAALVVVSLLFGGNYVVAKYAFREVSPLTLMAFRVTGAALLLGALVRLRGASGPRTPFTRRDVAEVSGLSLLGVVVNQICFLEGLSRSSATNAGLIFITVPVLTLATALVLRREAATARGVAGVAIGLAGAVTLVLLRGNVTVSSEAALGNLFLFTGASVYSFYLVLARGILARHDALRVTAGTFYFAAVVMLPFTVLGVIDIAGRGLTLAGWSSVGYVIVGATAMPYFLNSWALARVPSSVAGIYIFVQPLVAGWLGHLLFDERLAPGALLAGVLILVGVALTAWRPRLRRGG